MTFKEKLQSDIETLQKLLEIMQDNNCDSKSIAIVSGFLNTAIQLKELENA